ncbi:MAG: hypothetical protein Q8M19_14160 [Reyranella sp.]|nr:hypothetical protein [Reyranella sp.]
MTTRPAPIRILLAGHSGVSKSRIIDRISEALQKENKSLRHVKFEKSQMDHILAGTPNTVDQKETVLEFARKAITEVETASDSVDLIILSMHLSYFASGLIIQPQSWHVTDGQTNEIEPIIFKYIVGKFAPHYVATIIDDIQAAHRKVKSANVTLKDLLRWRNAETYSADSIANLTHFYAGSKRSLAIPANQSDIFELYPYEFSPVIASRNDVRSFTRFFLNKDLPRVYSSFPISRPRTLEDPKKSEATIAEINRHNAWLCSKFTVFNPAAIDELPMVKALEQFLKGKGDKPVSLDERITIEAGHHWPLDWGKTIIGEARTAVDLFVKDVFEISARLYAQTRDSPTQHSDAPSTGAEQMLRLIDDESTRLPGQSVAGKSDLDYQIAERDFRMIDQSDCVVIYRPTLNSKNKKYDGKWSGGTQEEYRYALGVDRKVVVIRDTSHDLELDEDKLGLLVSAFRILNGSNLHLAENQNAMHLELEDWIQKNVDKNVQERVRQTEQMLSAMATSSADDAINQAK